MPSLWKKQKGNRISRLVADLQTPPKRGGSLVVETGFPTSLVDLFVKNRDKLKKSKKKKHKSKQKTATEDDDHPFSISSSVSNSHISFSQLEVPRCAIDQNLQEDVAHVDNSDLFVDELVARENRGVELYHDCCKDDDHEEGKENEGVLHSKKFVWGLVFTGTLSVVVALFTKRWVVVGITLGLLLLLLLECVRNSVFRWFKSFEGVVLKGPLVVIVALCTKRFVEGVTMGALLLLLLEYLGGSVFRFFKPCEDAKLKSRFFSPSWDAFKQWRVVDERNAGRMGWGILKGAVVIGLKREAHKEDGYDVVGEIEQEEVGNGVVLRRAIKTEFGDGLISKRELEVAFEEYGNGISLKGEIEELNKGSALVNEDSCLVEEEVRNKPIYEIETLEPNCSEWPRSLNFSGHVGYYDLQGREGTMGGRQKGGGEVSVIVDHDSKTKKSTKFWKKLVPKKIHKKKKHKHEIIQANSIQGSVAELEEEDELREDERGIDDGEKSLTSSSNGEDEGETGNLSAANLSYTEMLQIDNRTTKSNGIAKQRERNLRCLTTMVIPLVGLIGGRIFAVVLTVICCLVFKMGRC